MLERRKHYLQVALNSSLEEGLRVVDRLPVSDRIIIEAGTPLIKAHGIYSVYQIRERWSRKLSGTGINPYIVADLKTMDRGSTEVSLAKSAGASAVIGLGQAPMETIDSFIGSCRKEGIDSMLDMMNVEQPVKVLRKLKHQPTVVILHRGADEEEFNRDKPIPYIQINKVRAGYDVMISIGGGDTIREVQRAVFNGADIVMVWKNFLRPGDDTPQLAQDFLNNIK